eukprot:14898372-Heterocapsa_arctica.AAC.1
MPAKGTGFCCWQRGRPLDPGLCCCEPRGSRCGDDIHHRTCMASCPPSTPMEEAVAPDQSAD